MIGRIDGTRWVLFLGEHLVVENLSARIKKQELQEDIIDFLVPEITKLYEER
jgi:hypothetical protein